MKRKFFALLMALVLILGVGLAKAAPEKRLSIVCTTFPSYDWMREILGERLPQVDLTLLQDSGVDLHNFQPTAEDFVKVSSADLFVYIGGLSDHWVKDAVKEAKNKDMVVVNLMQLLGDDVKMEAVVEGMQEGASLHDHDHHEDADHDHDDHHEDADHDHDDHHEDADHDHDDHHEDADHDHDDHHEDADHDHDHKGHHHAHEDEHIWLSLDFAEDLVEDLAKILGKMDPEHKDLYKANAKAYEKKLDALDDRFEDLVKASQNKTVLFGDRFPFRYLMDDYKLSYYAAFTGCSAETEASFETVAFLSQKMDELSLPAILVLEGGSKGIAMAILNASQNPNRPILALNSMQSMSMEDVEDGMTYLGIMEENLQVLAQALQ